MLIRRTTVDELESLSNIYDLLAEYAKEASITGLPTPSVKAENYRLLDSSGKFHMIGAFCDGKVIGFITIISTLMPHYGVVISVVESFFVAKQFRSTGAGIKMLREAEKFAKSIGSPGLLVSAPYGGALSKVLPRSGYAQTNQVFFRKFSDE